MTHAQKMWDKAASEEDERERKARNMDFRKRPCRTNGSSDVQMPCAWSSTPAGHSIATKERSLDYSRFDKIEDPDEDVSLQDTQQQNRADQLQKLLSVQEGLSKIKQQRKERWEKWQWDEDSLKQDADRINELD